MPIPGTQQLFRAVRTANRLKRRLEPGRQQRDDAFSELRKRFYDEFWADAADAVGAELEELGFGYRLARKGDTKTLIAGDKVALDDHVRVRAARNKAFVERWLSPLGYRGPRSVLFDVGSLDRAQGLLEDVGQVVVKPADGEGAGRGVTTQIRTRSDLWKATLYAATLQPKLLAEEQVEGGVYRLLYLHGELIDVVRRDSPRLTGDGASRVEELVDSENARRLTSKWTSLSPLELDLDASNALSGAALSAKSRPASGQSFVVKRVVNQNNASENHSARDEFHQETVALCSKLSEAMGLALTGVDILTPDPARPLQEVGIINEINSTPGLHHHFLISDPAKRVPVGAQVLEAALQ